MSIHRLCELAGISISKKDQEFLKLFGHLPSNIKEVKLFTEEDFQEDFQKDEKEYVLVEGKEFLRKENSTLDKKYKHVLEERNRIIEQDRSKQ